MELSKALRKYAIKWFVEQEERGQIILFPERHDNYLNEDNPVRVADAFHAIRKGVGNAAA
jgi:hypothetical protein